METVIKILKVLLIIIAVIIALPIFVFVTLLQAIK